MNNCKKCAVFVYEHKERGDIKAVGLEDARKYDSDKEWWLIGSIHAPAYIEHTLKENPDLIEKMKGE